MDSSSLVIKVKYGDTLRRFSVLCSKNGSLDLDMGGLRAKILNLFKFAPDADLTLTYLDEDNDVVTLVDDDDLCDAIRQHVNPLRINVILKSSSDERFDARSSGSATPVTSTPSESYQPSVTSTPSESHPQVVKVLRSVPEPLRDALTKLSQDLTSKAAFSATALSGELREVISKAACSATALSGEPLREVISKVSHDLASKAAPSAPILAELLESLTKLALSGDGLLSQSSDGSSLNPQPHHPDKVEEHENHHGLTASKEPVSVADVSSNAEVVDPANKSVRIKARRLIRPSFQHPKVDLKGDVNDSGSSAANNSVSKPLISSDDKGKNVRKECHAPIAAPLSDYSTLVNESLDSGTQPVFTGYGYGGFDSNDVDNKKKNLGNGSMVFSPQNNPSFCGQMGSGASVTLPYGGLYYGNPFMNNFNYSNDNTMGRIFHKGVQCDGCGAHPITGPRFKSKVKLDYDLCSICFSEMGNETEYIKIDRPRAYRSQRILTELQVPFQHPRFRSSSLPGSRRCPMRPYGQKFDSLFIHDVNIADGTQMTPGHSFTKIWRMHNNGTITWPRGSQLIWIGGAQLTNIGSIEVEIPVEGILPEKDLDIAVDFTAPEEPGQYISYWRMALPSGQKFGQCVWVLIQVQAESPFIPVPVQVDYSQSDAHFFPVPVQVVNSEPDASLVQVNNSQPNAPTESPRNLNLNFPPESNPETKRPLIDVNAEPIDISPLGGQFGMGVELVKPMVFGDFREEEATDMTKSDDGLPTSNAKSVGVPPPEEPVINQTVAVATKPSDEVLYPDVVTSPLPSIDYSAESFTYVPASCDEVGGGSSVVEQEKALLKELYYMGFKQTEWNKEILRKNEYDLEQSLDDLCGVAEWDPILEELQEMGFRDKETNRRLLVKNGGSIKRVVMDLIAGESER